MFFFSPGPGRELYSKLTEDPTHKKHLRVLSITEGKIWALPDFGCIRFRVANEKQQLLLLSTSQDTWEMPNSHHALLPQCPRDGYSRVDSNRPTGMAKLCLGGSHGLERETSAAACCQMSGSSPAAKASSLLRRPAESVFLHASRARGGAGPSGTTPWLTNQTSRNRFQ